VQLKTHWQKGLSTGITDSARRESGKIAVAAATQRSSFCEARLDNGLNSGRRIHRGDFACGEGVQRLAQGSEVLMRTQVTLHDKFGNRNFSVNRATKLLISSIRTVKSLTGEYL
jgi:hypothetical protein